MVFRLIKPIDGAVKDAKFEALIALLPAVVGVWSFEWAVIAALCLIGLGLVELIRITRLSGIVAIGTVATLEQSVAKNEQGSQSSQS